MRRGVLADGGVAFIYIHSSRYNDYRQEALMPRGRSGNQGRPREWQRREGKDFVRLMGANIDLMEENVCTGPGFGLDYLQVASNGAATGGAARTP